MSKKILVLDDDADLLEIIEMIITSEGYEILTLDSDYLVMESIIAFKPDLILWT